MTTTPKKSGWLCLNKPLGIPSTKLLNRLKKYFPKTKIGHAGTLDPLASGVLPVAIGEATKVIPYAQDKTKTYFFEVTWGAQTGTDDLEGDIIKESANRPSLEAISNLLPSFTGTIQQRPPSYSALKINGKRAYDLARSGQEVSLTPRSIDIEAFTFLEHTGKTTSFEVTCGKGTYIRSLARDLGIQLGCYGHVSILKRLKVGPFSLENSFDGKNLLENTGHPDIESQLMPLGCVLDDIPDIMLSKGQEALIRTGQCLPLERQDPSLKGLVVCKTSDGTVCAMADVRDEFVHPKRVFNLD